MTLPAVIRHEAEEGLSVLDGIIIFTAASAHNIRGSLGNTKPKKDRRINCSGQVILATWLIHFQCRYSD